MNRRFPYTNFHELNLNWIIKQIKELFSTAVFTVNQTPPDENGNVNLSGVSGVTSVCGIGADGAGNVPLTATNVGAIPDTILQPWECYVDPVNGADTNPGSAANPYKTIQNALQEIYSKTVQRSTAPRIHLAGGTYNENIRMFNLPDIIFVVDGNAFLRNMTLGTSNHIEFVSDNSSVIEFEYSSSYIPDIYGSERQLLAIGSGGLLKISCDMIIDCQNALNIYGMGTFDSSDVQINYPGNLTIRNCVASYAMRNFRAVVKNNRTMTLTPPAIYSQDSIYCGIDMSVNTIDGTGLITNNL